MRRNVIKTIIGVFVVIFIMVTISFAEQVSAQSPPEAKKNKSKKQTISKEKTSVTPVKKNNVDVPDEREFASNYATQAIRRKIVKFYQSGNISPMFGDIIVNDKYPLIIQLSTEKEGSLDLSGAMDNVSIVGKANMSSNDMEHVLIPKTSSTKGIGSVSDNVWHTSADTAAAIKSGKITCAGSFMINGKPITFINGNVTFTDLVKPGFFSEGTTITYDGVNYSFIAGNWVKGENSSANEKRFTAGEIEKKLFDASKKGELNLVKSLLASGANINSKNEDGWSALILATEKGNTDIVEYLLTSGADVNIMANDGVTALSVASFHGHKAIVDALLRKGAIVNVKGSMGDSALRVASFGGHAEIVMALIANGAEVNDARRRDGWTALMLAAANGHLKVVEELLAKGAMVNIKNKDGLTALMFASAKGNIAIVTTLLKKGAEVNAIANNGLTALILASTYGHTTTAQTLLNKGADINMKVGGMNARMIASQNGHKAIANILKAAEETPGRKEKVDR